MVFAVLIGHKVTCVSIEPVKKQGSNSSGLMDQGRKPFPLNGQRTVYNGGLQIINLHGIRRNIDPWKVRGNGIIGNS